MIKGNIRETAKLNANKKYETKHTKEIYNREYHEESDVYIYIYIYRILHFETRKSCTYWIYIYICKECVTRITFEYIYKACLKREKAKG